MTFLAWVAELERLRGKSLGDEREAYRDIWQAGEDPQEVIDEWGVEDTIH